MKKLFLFSLAFIINTYGATENLNESIVNFADNGMYDSNIRNDLREKIQTRLKVNTSKLESNSAIAGEILKDPRIIAGKLANATLGIKLAGKIVKFAKKRANKLDRANPSSAHLHSSWGNTVRGHGGLAAFFVGLNSLINPLEDYFTLLSESKGEQKSFEDFLEEFNLDEREFISYTRAEKISSLIYFYDVIEKDLGDMDADILDYVTLDLHHFSKKIKNLSYLVLLDGALLSTI